MKFRNSNQRHIKDYTNIFNSVKNLIHMKKYLQAKYDDITDELFFLKDGGIEKDPSKAEKYHNLLEERNSTKAILDRYIKAENDLKKLCIKVGAIVLSVPLAATMATGMISHGINQRQEKQVQEAIKIVSQQYGSLPYQNVDISELADSPNEITEMALKVFKSNLADYYGVDNPDDFKFYYNAYNDDGNYNTFSEYNISYQDKIIASYLEKRNISNGEPTCIKNTLSPELRKLIDLLVKSQQNPEDKGASFKALTGITNNSSVAISTSLPDTLPNLPDAPDKTSDREL